jgi:hypothetical protein
MLTHPEARPVMEVVVAHHRLDVVEVPATH